MQRAVAERPPRPKVPLALDKQLDGKAQGVGRGRRGPMTQANTHRQLGIHHFAGGATTTSTSAPPHSAPAGSRKGRTVGACKCSREHLSVEGEGLCRVGLCRFVAAAVAVTLTVAVTQVRRRGCTGIQTCRMMQQLYN